MTADAEGLHPIANTANPQRRADIVFIHGLGGGSHSTWRHGKTGKNDHFFWPEELGLDLPDCGIWSLGYPAGFTGLGPQGMIIEKRAGNVADTLANAGLGDRPILFITHSMGGLIVKHLVVDSQMRAGEDRKRIVAQLRGIVFCGTPHSGSGFSDAAGVFGLLGGGSQAHVKEMKANAEKLDLLHDKFVEWHRRRPIPIDSYAESRKLSYTRFLFFATDYGVVVPRASANPGLAGCEVHDLDDDHLTLVKPRNRQHNVYAGVLRFIRKALEGAPVEATETRPKPAQPAPAPDAHQAPGATPAIPIDLTHLPAGAPHFLGREAELATLDAAWESAGQTTVVELIAPGGTGKTALVKRWLAEMKAAHWRGAARVFGWSFYSQGTSDDRQASEDPFLAAALAWFGVAVAPTLGPWDKGRRLAEAVAARRTLLILDGVEPLQYPPGLAGRGHAGAVGLAGGLRAPGLQALLGHLAGAGQPGLCVLSSRERVQDLAEWADGPAPSVRRIDLGDLDDRDGARLLHTLGVRHAGGEAIGPEDAELLAASHEVRGHALTLSLLGGYLALAYEGDCRRRDQVALAEADAEGAGGHAFRVIAAYERWFTAAGEAGARQLAALRLLGFFDRPASAANLEALRQPPAIKGLTEALFTKPGGWFAFLKRPTQINDAEWRATLKHLEALGLLWPTGEDGLDAHPLVREYLAATLKARQPAAWQEGHRRLYAQLKASAPHRPEGLAALQPLYQAVAHGCQAGLWQEACDEVYFDRILRGSGADGFYSWKKLGAFGDNLGALACFFVEPWRRPAPALGAGDQAWLLNEAAFSLRALGRLEEALEPMRAGAEMAVDQGNWKEAAIIYSNLSELQLGLGRVAEAVADAGRAVVHADRGADAFWRMATRTTLADALHQQGEAAAAAQRFAEAEAMQAERQPQYPLLYSLAGFRYCDLLLAGAERAAGLGADGGSYGGSNGGTERGTEGGAGAQAGVARCAEVAARAGQTLAWVERANIDQLSAALDHLTLARCALTADLLQGRPPGATARQETEQALRRLRAAGDQMRLPLGLLTRARLLHALGEAGADTGRDAGSDTGPAAGPLAQAAADLAEAERIARRGSMRLHLADCLLTRARLFHDRPALAEARRLIEECGYGRRRGELADAEAEARNWPH